MKDETEYLERVARHCQAAVGEFAAASGNPDRQRHAICRYFKRGYAAGLSTGELVDFLGIGSTAVLDGAGYSETESQAVMELVGEISDEEIEREPI